MKDWEKILLKERFCLKKKNRLRNKKEFQAVYQNGKSIADGNSILIVSFTKSVDKKIGLAVGKKTGNAVKRNGAKRKMREIFRTNQAQIIEGISIIWVAKKNLVNRNIADYEKSFFRLITKAGLIRK